VEDVGHGCSALVLLVVEPIVSHVRRVVNPLLAIYYAIPIFVFYPFFVVLFGLNRYLQIAIGFLLAVVAMIVNTLNGSTEKSTGRSTGSDRSVGCRVLEHRRGDAPSVI